MHVHRFLVGVQGVCAAARAQAKYALPRGGGPAPRTTRIFVARIPLSVSDAQFRQYFEQFGHVQVRARCCMCRGHEGGTC